MSPSTSDLKSRLYVGRVMHRRLIPFQHRFTYRVFTMLFDLAEIDALARRIPFFSRNRLNLISFWDRDHGARDGSDPRGWIEEHLKAAGVDSKGGPIRLLCMPRILGYAFNPLSVWFCYHRSGKIAAVFYEVRNTFGQWHGYLMPQEEGAPNRTVLEHACDKEFYVSPFIDMAAHYGFRTRLPDDRLSLLIRQRTAEGDLLQASITGRARAVTTRTLGLAWLTQPLLTLKVIAAIHFEAIRLLAKGARFHRRPSEPDRHVTVVRADAVNSVIP